MSKDLDPKKNKKVIPKGVNEEKSFQYPEIKKNKKKSRESFIPKAVANRMARRVIFTTGLPTLSGMGVFIISYLLIIKGITDVPPAITLASSALCFLIGLIGLSYGILSASWDDSPGSLLGFENIQPNIERMRNAFKTVNTKK
ncbi:PAM68 family protein [Prochlorococcus marinus]|uniref:DUF3464 domain-containing protein n=1 Tax=Prochlorococcus marinus (strain MIT 9211) TaxID=93059 RepID=A9B9W9_PROM4|nr:PAM68 family protein [Prochlorococcus marinus]ABX08631.1 conserved hypothetical protein [Prochlorococcus marinus str. MIT 9211]